MPMVGILSLFIDYGRLSSQIFSPSKSRFFYGEKALTTFGESFDYL